jgi:hypothetical protein
MTNDEMMTQKNKQKIMVVIDVVFFYEKNWMLPRPLPAPFFSMKKIGCSRARYPHHFFL